MGVFFVSVVLARLMQVTIQKKKVTWKNIPNESAINCYFIDTAYMGPAIASIININEHPLKFTTHPFSDIGSCFSINKFCGERWVKLWLLRSTDPLWKRNRFDTPAQYIGYMCIYENLFKKNIYIYILWCYTPMFHEFLAKKKHHTQY